MTAPTAARINPMVVGATSSLICAQGAQVFTAGCRNQMLRLAACTAQGLRAPEAPVVGVVKKFRAAIGTGLTTIEYLVKEHAEHWLVQADYAKDPNLFNAMRGYLDAMELGGTAALGDTTGAGSGNVAAGAASFEVDGTIRTPKGAWRAMEQCTAALTSDQGQAGAMRTMRARLVGPELNLPADSPSPQLLAKLNEQLVAVGRIGDECAAEFARQFRKIHALPKKLRTTQYGTGGWADPKYAF